MKYLQKFCGLFLTFLFTDVLGSCPDLTDRIIKFYPVIYSKPENACYGILLDSYHLATSIPCSEEIPRQSLDHLIRISNMEEESIGEISYIEAQNCPASSNMVQCFKLSDQYIVNSTLRTYTDEENNYNQNFYSYTLNGTGITQIPVTPALGTSINNQVLLRFYPFNEVSNGLPVFNGNCDVLCLLSDNGECHRLQESLLENDNDYTDYPYDTTTDELDPETAAVMGVGFVYFVASFVSVAAILACKLKATGISAGECLGARINYCSYCSYIAIALTLCGTFTACYPLCAIGLAIPLWRWADDYAQQPHLPPNARQGSLGYRAAPVITHGDVQNIVVQQPRAPATAHYQNTPFEVQTSVRCCSIQCCLDSCVSHTQTAQQQGESTPILPPQSHESHQSVNTHAPSAPPPAHNPYFDARPDAPTPEHNPYYEPPPAYKP